MDIDPVHNHILTGSWRKESILQVDTCMNLYFVNVIRIVEVSRKWDHDKWLGYFTMYWYYQYIILCNPRVWPRNGFLSHVSLLLFLQIWDYSNGEKIKDVPIDKMHTSLVSFISI